MEYTTIFYLKVSEKYQYCKELYLIYNIDNTALQHYCVYCIYYYLTLNCSISCINTWYLYRHYNIVIYIAVPRVYTYQHYIGICY